MDSKDIDRYFGEQPADDTKQLPEYISIVSSTQCARVKIADIMCVEQEGRKLHIITAEKDYTLYENMSNIISSLAERAFYRPMKCLIINFDHVKDITGGFVSFFSGQTVTMGKNSASRTRKAFRKYLMRYPPYNMWNPAPRVMEIRKPGKNYDLAWDVAEDEKPYNPKYDEELQPAAYQRMRETAAKKKQAKQEHIKE